MRLDVKTGSEQMIIDNETRGLLDYMQKNGMPSLGFPDFEIPCYIVDPHRMLVAQSGHGRLTVAMDTLMSLDLRLGGVQLREEDRGKVLSQFCLIEFILDVLVCIGEGVYEDPPKYTRVNGYLTEDSTTTSVRIKYARDKKLISKSTKEKLWKIKNVRNILAHQFFPDLPLNRELMSFVNGRYDEGKPVTPPEGLSILILDAWKALLIDYSKIQYRVARYIIDIDNIALE